MVKTGRRAGFLAAFFLISAAPAHAAFSPDLGVELTPPAVNSSPALTATISRPATDTPIERFTLTLPAGFVAAGAPGAASCDPATLAAGACPADTQIGSFTGSVEGTVPLSGAITKTGSESFGLYVSYLGGAISQVVEGSLVRRASGALDLRFDQLPALPITNLALSFSGGALSLIRTPASCGTYTIDGKFTSSQDEFVVDRKDVALRDCDGTPTVRVENVRFSDRSFKAGGSAYSGRTIIAWWLSEAVDHTNLRIQRRKNDRWRKVGTLVGTGNAGDNSLRWDGRLRGRELEPGRYAVRIQPAGTTATKRFRFRILR